MKNYREKNLTLILPLLAAGLFLFPTVFAHSARAQAKFDSPVRVCREFEIDRGASGVTASDNAILFYLSAEARYLNAISLGDLRNLWAIEPGGRILDSPRRSGADSIYILTESPDAFVLRSFSVSSGLARRSVSYPKTEFRQASLLANSLLLLSVSNDLRQVALGSAGTVWEINGIDANLSGAVIGAEHFALDKAVFETRSGRVILTLDQQFVSEVLGFRGDSEVFAAGRKGEIFVYDLRKQRLRWRFKTGGKITSAVATGNAVIIGSTDNYLYKFDLRKGILDWKARLSDRILDRPVVIGGFLFIANQLKNSVEIHDLKDGRLINRLEVPGDSAVIAVLASSSGALVFTSKIVYEVASQCLK